MKGLKVKIGGDTSGFEAGIARVRAQAAMAARSMAGGIGNQIMGLASASALAVLTRQTMAYADDIEETASRIGVSTDKLQEWSFAAKQSGASVEKLTRFIEQLTDAAADPKKNKALLAMGINAKGMTPEKLFEAVSKFARGKSSTDVRAALGDIVNSKQIGSMMNLLQSDLDEVGKAARDAGAVMRSELLHSMATLNDQFSIISQILYTQFAPALLEVSKVVLRTVGAIGGTAASLGAKTAGLSWTEMLLGPFMSKKQQEAIFERTRKDPNTAYYSKTGDSMFADKVLAIETLIKSFENWKPAALPTIGSPAAERPEKLAVKEMELDALSKAGLFAGGAGSAMMNSIPLKTLSVLEQVERNTSATTAVLEEGL